MNSHTRRIVFGLIVFLTTSFWFAGHLRAQDNYDIESVGYFGGMAYCGEAQNDVAYIGEEHGITVYRADNNSVTQLGPNDMPTKVLAMQAVGDFLYVLLDEQAGFYVLDIHDPASPDSLGWCGVGVRLKGDVYADSNLVYVVGDGGGGEGGFQIVDVSNPASPRIVKKVDGYFPESLVVSGGYAFAISAPSKKFWVFDLSDPLNPTLKGELDVEYGSQVTVSGNHAYVSCAHGHELDENGLRVIDISDPANPVEKSYFSTPNEAYSVVVHENDAYLGTEASLLILDVSNETAPQQIGSFKLTDAQWSQFRGFHYANGSVYATVLGKDLPFLVLDVTNPGEPQERVSHETPGTITSLCTSTSQLFVSSYNSLFVYDLNGSSLPVLQQKYADFGNCGFMQFYGSNLFIAYEEGEKFVIVDAKNPANLTKLGEYKEPSDLIGHFAVQGRNAYLQTYGNKLEIIDLTNYEAPQRVASLTLPGEARDIAAKDTLVFSAYRKSPSNRGVEIYSAASPANPLLIIRISTDGTPNAVWVKEDTLYIGGNITNEEYFLQAFDISNPALPRKLAKTTGSGILWDVEVREDAILAAVYGKGVVRFVLDAQANTLRELSKSKSEDCLLLSTAPPDNNGYCLLFTADGKSWSPPTAAFNTNFKSPRVSGTEQVMTGSVFGNYGMKVQKFKVKRKSATPVLSLSKGIVEYIPTCPSCDSSEKIIASVKIGVDEVDSWQVHSIKFSARGTGNVNKYVKKAILYVNNQLTDSSQFNAAGDVVLKIKRLLPPGSAINVKLAYRFCFPETRDRDQFGEYGVFTKGTWVSAEPEHFSIYEKLPVDGFSCGNLLVAPVENLQTQKYFSNIQDAIYDNSTQDGHMIAVCSGKYTENIAITKSITLASRKGRSFTTIYSATGAQPTILIAADNVKLRGFTLAAGVGGSDEAVLVNKSGGKITGCRIEANSFEGNTSGVRLLDAWSCLIRDNIFQQNMYGIMIEGNSSQDTVGGDLTQDRNFIFSNRKDGIFLNGSEIAANVIKGNYIGVNQALSANVGNGENGIHLKSGHDNYIGHQGDQDGNIIAGNKGDGILIEGDGARRNSVECNFIGTDASLKKKIPNEKYGIEIATQAFATFVGDSLNKDAGNFISNNKLGGLLVNGNKAADHVIANNVFSGNGQFGVGLRNGSGQVYVQMNIIDANKGNGIFIEGQSNENRIIKNEITKNAEFPNSNEGGEGLKIIGSDGTIVRDNVISHNIAGGVEIFGGSQNKIEGNSLDENFYAAILLTGGDKPWGHNEVNKNKIQKGFSGIQIRGGEIGNLIEKNDVRNCEIGINMEGSDSNLVRKNSLYSDEGSPAAKYGIVANISNFNRIRENEIHNSKVGIALIDGKKNGVEWNKIVSSEVGIRVVEESEKNSIYDNEILQGKKFYGIYFNHSNSNTIMNNRLSENDGVGMGFEFCQRNVIRNNEVGKTTCQEGIFVHGALYLYKSDYNIILNNHLHHTKEGEGIWLSESLGNTIKENFIEKNEKDGILLENSRKNRVVDNQITSNNISYWLDSYAGVSLYDTQENDIRGNRIWHNCSGIQEKESHNNVFANNSIKNSTCPNTGIHVYGSRSKITGNDISGNNGAAIHCENGSAPTILNNSITANNGDGIKTESGSTPVILRNIIARNSGFGLNNVDPGVTVRATDNWWGNAAGPNAGDGINGNADFGDWRTEANSVVASAAVETLYVRIGTSDSVACSFQNWKNRNDGVQVRVSDSQNWLQSANQFTLAFKDSTGADTLIYLTVPASVKSGSTSKIMISASSVSEPSLQDRDSVIVIAYLSALERITVLPDSIVIGPGASVHFSAYGFDQMGTRKEFDPVWSASGGVIDSTGRFTADSSEGAVTITVKDAASPASATAHVLISAEAHVLAKIVVSPDSVRLKPGEMHTFEAKGYDQFDMKMVIMPQWSTTGGIIDNHGIFTAPDEAGTFTITAKDTAANLAGQAVVIVTSTSSVQQNTFLPKHYRLFQNFPNPFNPQTTIRFDVKSPGHVRLAVFDVLGQEKKVLVNSDYPAGTFKVVLDSRNLPSGIYFYRIQMGNFTAVRKLLLLK